MKAKELIELNNHKREALSPENLKYYEDMLVYIRLSFDKSEQETEEILLELLEHLLEAQAAGKSAAEIFGENPKLYAEQIIGELPKMVTRKRLLLVAMGILYFLAVGSIFSGVFDFVLYVTSFGLWSREVFLGSVVLKTLLSIPIALALVFGVVHYIRWSCFRTYSRVKDFLVFWFFGICSVGVFMAVLFLVPKFGWVFQIPFYVDIALGAGLFIAAEVVRRIS